MIRWALVLTSHQISILSSLKKRQSGKPFSGIRHFGARAGWLVRQGLLESKGADDRDLGGEFLTDRGRFILDIVEKDMASALVGVKA